MGATTTTDADRSESSSQAGSLLKLLDEKASAKEIARYLDGLSPSARVEEVLRITGRDVGRLYEAVNGSEPLTLEDFAPEGEKGTVIFEGRNSLPMFTRFQKRFTRMGDRVVGYNHQTMSFVTGPGYFVVKTADGAPPVGDELYFDYTTAPPSAPAGWPDYKSNERGLSRAVYANMKDYIRRVAKGVVVGKAYKLGVDQKAWFSLSRAI